MRKEKLNTLLDSIYELEGLVHLAITRDDEPAMLPELIRRKSRELLAHAEKATAGAESEVGATYVNGAEQVQIEASTPEVAEDTAMQPTYLADTQEQVAQIEEYSVMPGEYEISTEESEKPDVTTEVGVAVEEEERMMPEAEVLSIFQSAPESDHDSASETDPEIVLEPEVKTESKPKAVSQKDPYKFQSYTEPRGRLVFSINDRYRFKRELFHGSDVDFNTTLSLVASMDGYDEAEDYFLNDLQWDEKSPDVIDFLEMLKNYFK